MNTTQKLYYSQLLRIILTLVILYLPIPLFTKIILISLSDLIDCAQIYHSFFDWVDCKSDLYQKSDKITDIICYVLLLLYILKNDELSTRYKHILTGLLTLRLIGTFLFISTNNRKYLFYFPNLFIEMALLFSIITYYKLSYKHSLVILVVIFKLIQEYIMHY